jgi:hypothetical protein
VFRGLLAAEKVSGKMEENSRKRKSVRNGILILKSILFFVKKNGIRREKKVVMILLRKKSRKR